MELTQDSNKRTKTAIIGKGNVGSHLYNAFKAKGIDALLLDSRSLEGLSPDFDVVILAVSDPAISEVAGRVKDFLKDFKGTVAHTAGSMPLDTLSSFFTNYGVFYPLQTFSKSVPIEDYNSIPVFIEANNPGALSVLENLGKRVFNTVYVLPSEKRRWLHLAAVFACNFSNAMYAAADDILRSEGIPFEAIKPLIQQTALKVAHCSPKDSQTGPAARKDSHTISSQLEMLKNYPELYDIYQDITNYILTFPRYE